MKKIIYEIWINGLKKGEITVTDETFKKCENKATKAIQNAYELTASDIVGLIISKIEIL